MVNTRYKKLQDLKEELDTLRSIFDSFWVEMSPEQRDYLANIEQQIIDEIRLLERQFNR